MNSTNIIEKYKSCVDRVMLTYEHPDAIILDPSISKLLGCDIINKVEEIASIRNILQESEFLLNPTIYEWSLRSESYPTNIEAHFQFLVMWCLQLLNRKIGSKLDSKVYDNISVRIINNRKISPFIIDKSDFKFIILPTGFIKMLDNYYRTYFYEVSRARRLDLTSIPTPTFSEDPRHELTDNIGGLSIWRAMKLDYDACRPSIFKIMLSLASNEMFADEIQIINTDEGMDTLLKCTSGFLGYKLAELRLGNELTIEVSSAIYLTTVFALFHEISHLYYDKLMDKAKEIIKHDLRLSFPKDKGESIIDSIALHAYGDYIDYLKVNNKLQIGFDKDFINYIFGPFSMLTVAKNNCLVLMLNNAIQSKTKPAENPNHLKLKSIDKELGKRRSFLIDSIGLTYNNKNIEQEDMVKLFSTIREFYIFYIGIKEFMKPTKMVNLDIL